LHEIGKDQVLNNPNADESTSKVVICGDYSFSISMLQFLANILKCDILRHNSKPNIMYKAYKEIETVPSSGIMGVLFSCILKFNRLNFSNMRAIVLGRDPEIQAMNIKK